MGSRKEKGSAADQDKKRKIINPVWRPVRTQANSSEGISESTLSSRTSPHKQVGASLFQFIKGKGGSTQKKIEDDLGVKIIFPTSKKEDFITIKGTSIDSMTRASKKIQAIIDEAVKSPNLNYSHFISLPLAIHPDIVDKLFSFQSSILGNSELCLNENAERDSNEDTAVNITDIPVVSYKPESSKSSPLSGLGIEKSIFIKPKTFHLTVLMLKLWNKDRVNAAAEVLQSISSRVMDALDNRPVFVRLKGLDCMRGSLAKACVLYAPVEEVGSEDRLLRACQVIIDAYVEAGLVLEKDAKQKLKLHATVMNASHTEKLLPFRKKRTRNVDSFDARGIFKQYGSQEWGDYLIREAHLSQRFVFDENGYYHCCAQIPFPENMQVD
ncbi:Activating signal cointegrator 1 complex subunit 1 [Quillaja saponaria]|uniref:Activating signal cointegrator 1 complex subunit 1 n=1 Tax=Quillaja saponaria TaxID=32244 RepID=A0AAD7LRJ5_QUISA|nr:Activating signal cointegrator 1 complex subunit 1 [Quillaja saponaria]